MARHERMYVGRVGHGARDARAPYGERLWRYAMGAALVVSVVTGVPAVGECVAWGLGMLAVRAKGGR
jgi:hypothetical protein